MQIKYYNHEELYYNSTNIEELNLDNQIMVNLVLRDVGYTYCILCDRLYPTNRIKFHTNNKKHIKYEYHSIISKSLSST